MESHSMSTSLTSSNEALVQQVETPIDSSSLTSAQVLGGELWRHASAIVTLARDN